MTENTQHDAFFKQKSENTDIIISLKYVADALRIHKSNTFAELIEDVAHMIENHTIAVQNLQDGKEEHLSIINMFMATKYASKITLDKYKEKTLTEITKVLQKNENIV